MDGQRLPSAVRLWVRHTIRFEKVTRLHQGKVRDPPPTYIPKVVFAGDEDKIFLHAPA